MAEWLRSGLQNRLHQFNSGRGLHPYNQGLSPITSEAAGTSQLTACQPSGNGISGQTLRSLIGPQTPPRNQARSPSARRPAIDQTQLRSSHSPAHLARKVANRLCLGIERIARILAIRPSCRNWLPKSYPPDRGTYPPAREAKCERNHILRN